MDTNTPQIKFQLTIESFVNTTGTNSFTGYNTIAFEAAPEDSITTLIKKAVRAIGRMGCGIIGKEDVIKLKVLHEVGFFIDQDNNEVFKVLDGGDNG